MSGIGWITSIVFALFAVPSLVVAWRGRKEMAHEDFAVITGCAVTVLALTGPWFGMDKLMRFNLIALIPTVILGGFLLCRMNSPRWRGTLAAIAVALLVGSSVQTLFRGGRAILSDDALTELRGLTANVGADPEHTLIAAQHGAEWWTSWFLRTRISQAQALKPEDWQKYKAVFFLEVKSGLQMPMFASGSPKPGIRKPPGFGPPGNGPGPMAAARIPADADIVHDGPCLRLARVKAMPQSNPASPRL